MINYFLSARHGPLPNPLNFLEPDSEVFQIDGGVCCHGAVDCLAAHARGGFVRTYAADWAIDSI
jgi:hypothetical protein